jgi:hypothetical protein
MGAKKTPAASLAGKMENEHECMNENGSSKPRPQSPAMNWIADVLKPLNMMFLLFSVISIVITIIIYLVSRQESHISYYTATIELVDQKEPGAFSVLDGVGRPVKENIYATNVTVWNSGDLPLDPDKIRMPLQISLTGDDTRLLDERFDYTTKNNISGFKFSATFKNIGGKDIKLDENAITEIRWKYFDPGEGFRFKLIYASREMQSVILKGIILGVNSFIDITPPPKGKISYKSPFPQMMISSPAK